MPTIIEVKVHGVAHVKHAMTNPKPPSTKSPEPCSWVTIFDAKTGDEYKLYLPGHVDRAQFPEVPTSYTIPIEVPKTLFVARGGSVIVDSGSVPAKSKM